MDTKIEISIIIPTLNEKENVLRVLNKITEFTQDLTHEVIFVDDNSNDGTIDTIKSVLDTNIKLIVSPIRKGLGNALNLGWSQSRGKFIMFLDCDSHISNLELRSLIELRSLSSLVIGSRYASGGCIKGAPLLKVYLSKFLNFLIGKYLKIPALDISHSLRIFPNISLEVNQILTHPGYFWLLSKKLQLMNISIIEHPVTFLERTAGKSKNTTIRMVQSVLRTLKFIKGLK